MVERDPSQGGLLARRALGLLVLTAIAVAFVDAAQATAARDVMPYAAAALVVPLLPAALERRPDPFSPPILTGAYAFVGMSAVLVHLLEVPQLSFREINLTGARAIEKTTEAFILLTLASVAYFAGYYGWKRGLGRQLLPDVRGWVWSRSRMFVVSAVLGAAFVGCYAYFQARIGTGLLELTLAEGKAVWRDDPTLSWMLRGIGLGQVPLLLFGAYLTQRGNLRSMAVVAVLAVAMAFLTMRTGGRGFAVSLLIGLGVVFHFLYRRIPSWFVVLAVIVALIGSNALGQLRAAGPDAVDGPRTSFRATEILAQHEDDRQRLLPMVTIVHTFPERRDLLLGETWAGIVAAPIPRWLWPGKVEAFRMRDTQIIMELAGSPTPCPLQFLLYANFGWPGVFIGMALWGAFHRGLARWREQAPKDPGTTLLYALVLIHFGPTLLQVSATMQWVIPCWLALVFVGQRSIRTQGKTAIPATP